MSCDAVLFRVGDVLLNAHPPFSNDPNPTCIPGTYVLREGDIVAQHHVRASVRHIACSRGSFMPGDNSPSCVTWTECAAEEHEEIEPSLN